MLEQWILVSDINGSREIILEGENGVIVPSRDADALYNAMKKILNNKELTNPMAESTTVNCFQI